MLSNAIQRRLHMLAKASIIVAASGLTANTCRKGIHSDCLAEDVRPVYASWSAVSTAVIDQIVFDVAAQLRRMDSARRAMVGGGATSAFRQALRPARMTSNAVMDIASAAADAQSG